MGIVQIITGRREIEYSSGERNKNTYASIVSGTAEMLGQRDTSKTR